MQPLEIDSAVFCDGARYTIISRENSSILTCPVASGAGGYTLNRVEGRDIDLELDRLTGHAACIAVDVPTWCRIAGDPLDAVADARSSASRIPPGTRRTPCERSRQGPTGPSGSPTRRSPHRAPRCHPTRPTPAWWRDLPPRRASAPARSPTPRRRPAAPRGPLARTRRARRAAAAPRSRGGAPWATLPVREHAFTLRASVPIIRAISAPPAPSARRDA